MKSFHVLPLESTTMRTFIFTLFSLLAVLPVLAQTPCSLDNSFDGDGKLVSDGNRMGEHIVVQSDGKVIVACNYFGQGHVKIQRFNTDGTVDNTFGVSGSCTIQIASASTDVDDMKLKNGIIYVCGSTNSGSNSYPFLAAVTSSGTLLTNFGSGSGYQTLPTSYYYATALDLDDAGNIYVCGLKSLDEIFVQKFTPMGGISSGFGSLGLVTFSTGNTNHWYEVIDIKAESNGKVTFCGKKYKANNGSTLTPFWNLMIMRLNSNGTLDNTFGNNGIALLNRTASSFDEARNIHLTAQNDYLISGNTYSGADYNYQVCKVKSNGTLDNSYGINGWSMHDLTGTNDQEYHLTSILQPDGRLLLGGNQGDGDTVYFALLMLKADGSTDNVFAPNGFYKHIFNQNNNSSGSGLALAPDGKIVMGGYTRTCSGGSCGPLYLALARYHNSAVATGLTDRIAPHTTLYPNPVQAGESIFIQSDQWHFPLAFRVLNLQGQTIQSGELKSSTSGIHMPSAGQYLLLLGKDQSSEIQSILVK